MRGPRSLSSHRKEPKKSERKNETLPSVKGAARGKKRKRASKSSEQIHSLQYELSSSKACLRLAIEEQENTSEELRAYNEELQNSMDELATANEELHSSNEELRTANEALDRNNHELNQANDDILNLFNSLSLNVVILDRDLRIRRLTPTAEKLFDLTPGDLGRRLSDTNACREISHLGEMIGKMMQTARMQQMEILGRDGQWYSLQVRPYVRADSKIDGAVLALLDVPELRRRTEELTRTNERLQEELLLRKQADEKFRTLFESAPEATIITDTAGKIVLANKQTEQLFGYRPEELVGKLLEVLVPECYRGQHAADRAEYGILGQTGCTAYGTWPRVDRPAQGRH